MKPFIFLITALIGASISAQNIVVKTIKNSDLQLISEQLVLEPGSEHTIDTSFIVEEDGTLTPIEASSEYPELQEEGLKIVRTIKKLVPSKVEGRPYIPYKIKLPIVFTVATLKYRAPRKRKDARRKKEGI
jgi:hypothetical protein